MIAAIGRNGVIGAGNAMPWHLPSDFAHFKRTTMGKPLPGRINIVVTRQKGYQPDGVLVIDSLDAAIDHASTMAEADGVDEVFIGGGGELYRQAMPLADRLYITEVDLAPEGDTVFPAIDPAQWVVVDEPEVPLNGKDSAAFRVKVYERRT